MKKMIILLVLAFLCSVSAALAIQKEARKYGEATTIDFPLYDSNSPHRLLVNAVSAAGDCQISKNESQWGVVDANFIDRGSFYSIALSATEMTATRIFVTIIDQSAPGLWMDHAISIDTASDTNHLTTQMAIAALPTAVHTALFTDPNNKILADANGMVTLAAAGLDYIPITEPNGVAGTYREMQVQTWRWFFKKIAQTATKIYTYNDAGTACTTQDWSYTGGVKIISDANGI